MGKLSSVLDFNGSSLDSWEVVDREQIRAARSLLGWRQSDLAKACGLSLTALNNIERGAADPRASNLLAIQRALEAAGILFIDENGGGIGVRLRQPRAKA